VIAFNEEAATVISNCKSGVPICVTEEVELQIVIRLLCPDEIGCNRNIEVEYPRGFCGVR
jgi:hypothetical protein